VTPAGSLDDRSTRFQETIELGAVVVMFSVTLPGLPAVPDTGADSTAGVAARVALLYRSTVIMCRDVFAVAGLLEIENAPGLPLTVHTYVATQPLNPPGAVTCASWNVCPPPVGAVIPSALDHVDRCTTMTSPSATLVAVAADDVRVERSLPGESC